jgi:hypothetical protein
MRFIRYKLNNQPPQFGWVIEDRVGPLSGSLFGEYQRLTAEIPFLARSSV